MSDTYLAEIFRAGVAYEKRAIVLSRKIRASLGVCAADSKLTPLAVRWWANDGAGMRTAPLGTLVKWKSLFHQRPSLAKIPVVLRRPKPDAGWDSAAARMVVLPSGKLRGISIYVNLCVSQFPHPQTLLDTIAHEIAHFIQADKGVLRGNLSHKTRNYTKSPLELEALACGRTVPLVPWPSRLLGRLDDFPRAFVDCMIPDPLSL